MPKYCENVPLFTGLRYLSKCSGRVTCTFAFHLHEWNISLIVYVCSSCAEWLEVGCFIHGYLWAADTPSGFRGSPYSHVKD